MYYEAMCLISPEVSSEEVFTLWEKMGKDIEKTGASIEKEMKPFEKNLAYPIKKGSLFRRAYVGVFYIDPKEQGSSLTAALKEKFDASSHVLRFNLLTLSALPELKKPAVPAAKKASAKEEAGEEKIAATAVREKEEKSEKPSIQDLDKKLEEILDDKIGF